MRCVECGNQISDNAKTCPYCGYVFTNATDVEGIEKKNSNKQMYMAVGVVLAILVVAFIFLATQANSKLLEEQIITLIKQNRIEDYLENDLELKLVEITSQTREDGCVKVVCDIEASNSDMYVDRTCEMWCLKKDGNWQVVSYEQLALNDVKPCRGVEEVEDGIEHQALRSFYPEIDWDGWYSSATNSSAVSCVWTVEHKTDLDNKTDQIVVGYWFYTHTAKIEGTMQLDYTFNDSGQWVYQSATKLSENKTWILEGVWSFDIYTYYVDVAIMNMDWENHIATLERRGSSFQGGGDIETIQVGFYEEDGCLYFDTFIIPKTFWGGSDKEITLTAKFDDLYYKCPSIFAGADPVDMAIGGRSQ